MLQVESFTSLSMSITSTFYHYFFIKKKIIISVILKLIFAYYCCYRDTYIKREKDEKVNDRNDRAIRAVAKWYQSHLASQGSNIRVALITDDTDNREKALQDGTLASTSKDKLFSFIL